MVTKIAIGIGGMAIILAIAFLLSTDRRSIRLRVVGAAFALQAAIAALVLGTSGGQYVIGGMSQGVSNLLGYAKAGTDFVFGPLATPEIGGFSTFDAQQMIRGLRGLDLVGGDVVEVSPPFDTGGTTALVGATMMFEILCVLAEAVAARRGRRT